MILGSTVIRQCASCGKHILQRTLMSGNTCGAAYWTDGKRDAPLLPDQPLLVKCPHCGAILWIKAQKQVGEIDWCVETTEIRFPLVPTVEDYAGFLKAGMNDKRKERYVRLRAWWAGNDQRRGEAREMPLDSFEIENLRAFITLLDEANDDDRLTKAEALRELGEFAAAEKLLAAKFAEQMKGAVSFIRDLNQKRITAVQEM